MAILDLLLILPSAMAIIFALMLFISSSSKARGMLGLFLLLIGLSLAYLFAFLDDIPHAYLLDWFITTCTLCGAPVFYIYVRQLTDRGTKKWVWALFIPAILISLTNLVLYLMMGDATATKYFDFVTGGGRLSAESPTIFLVKRIVGSYVYRAVCILSIIAVELMSIRMLKEYHKTVEDVVSNSERDSFLDNAIFWGYLTFLIGSIFMMVRPYAVASSSSLYWIGSAITSVGIFMIGYYGMQQHFNAQKLNDIIEVEDDTKAKKSTMEALEEELEKQIEEEFYLESGITIVDLAERMSTNRTYLSKAVHNKYGCSFSDFVNTLRVEHVIRLIRASNGKCVLKKVALDSGFQSASAMNHNFAKFKHVSPSEWIERYL